MSLKPLGKQETLLKKIIKILPLCWCRGNTLDLESKIVGSIPARGIHDQSIVNLQSLLNLKHN